MKSLTLKPISYINGIINLPGSKSISNRALLISALAKGTSILTNLLDSDDVRYMLNALKILGVNYSLYNKQTCCTLYGSCGVFNTEVPIKLFTGNAGTVMRFLTAALCLGKKNKSVILTGDSNMKKRPIGHLVDALRQGGAQIEYLEQENYPPLLLRGNFVGGNIFIDCKLSSQFLTAILIISPLAALNTVINIKGILVSKPYIDVTLKLMKTFGVLVKNCSYNSFIIHGRQQYQSPGNYLIEGDASSASYFLAAAAIKGGTVKVTGIGYNSIQGDIYFAKILAKMGAIIKLGKNFIECTRGELHAIDMDMNHFPDTAMTIAVTALFAKGTTTLRNIYNWRIKETDRLSSMATELRKIGAEIEEGIDYISITPPILIHHAKINTYNDHRMAMCFSLLALSSSPVTILNPRCIEKTFPNYFKYLACISKL